MQNCRSRWDVSHDESTEEVDPEDAGTSKTDRRAIMKCDVCEVECTSVETLQAHFSGARHKRRLSLKGLSPNFTSQTVGVGGLDGKVVACSLCKVMFHGSESALHFKSKKHRELCKFSDTALNALVVIADAPIDALDREEGVDIDIDVPERILDGYRCSLCDVTLPTREQFQAHVEAKKHQKKARWHYLGKEGEDLEVRQYWCRLCGVFCSDGDVLTAHYEGKGHLKVLHKKGLITDYEDAKVSQLSSDSDESAERVSGDDYKSEVWLSPSSFRDQKRKRSRSPAWRKKSCATAPSPPHKKRDYSPSRRPCKKKGRSPSPCRRERHCHSPLSRRKRGYSPSPHHKKERSRSPSFRTWKESRSSARHEKGYSPSPPPRRRMDRSPFPHRRQWCSMESSQSLGRSISRDRDMLVVAGSESKELEKGDQMGFHGFPLHVPEEQQPPEDNAPPNASLSVSFILHSLRNAKRSPAV